MMIYKRIKILLMLVILLSTTACDTVKDDGTDTTSGTESTTTVKVESTKTVEPKITVVKIDRFEDMEISDWLNDFTLIVSKENTTLEKMNLSELSDTYPRSLYLYNKDTDKYQLLKEQKDSNLGGATLSDDKKNLLYYEFSLGDPSFSVLNIDTLNTYSINSAMSAKWADSETVIGSSYIGGAYLSSVSGEITEVEGLKGEALVIVDKIKDNFYYNTIYDESLWKLALPSNEKIDLKMNHIYSIFPSPSENEILAIQSEGTIITLALYDSSGGNKLLLAEGREIYVASWSPNQKMIAYSIQGEINNGKASGLYIYDIQTGVSTQIAVDIKTSSLIWSPSGEQLAFTEWDSSKHDSGIVYLKLSK